MQELSVLTAALEALERRVAALQADRDYWRRQHDLVMADWKDDLARLIDENETLAIPSPWRDPPR